MKVKKDKHNFIIHLKDPQEIVRKGKKEDDDSSEDKEGPEEEQNLGAGEQQHSVVTGLGLEPAAPPPDRSTRVAGT